MPNDFLIPDGGGEIAASPGAGYCNPSPEFTAFLTAAFSARLSAQDATQKVFVGGTLYGLNQFTLSKQLETKHNASSSSDSKIKIVKGTVEHSIQSAEAARKKGKKITSDWYLKNCLPIAECAISAVTEKYPDEAEQQKIKIVLLDTNGVDQFPRMKPGLFQPESPDYTFTIQINDWNVLWANQPTSFTRELAQVVHYFEKGRALVQKLPSGESFAAQMQMYGLDQDSWQKLNMAYIDLQKLHPFSEQENQFLCEALDLSYSEFEKELQRLNQEQPDSESENNIAIITYTRISLAAFEFFSRQLQEKKFNPSDKKELTVYDKKDNSKDLVDVFRSNQQFMIAEAKSFKQFSGNILYPKPSTEDAIQRHMIEVVSAIDKKTLKFPVRKRPQSLEHIAFDGPTRKLSGDHDNNSPTLSAPISIVNTNQSTASNSSTGAASNKEKLGERRPSLGSDDLSGTSPQTPDNILKSLTKHANLAIKQACYPDNRYSVYLALGLLNQTIEWYKICVTALASAKNTQTKEILDNDKNYWKSVKAMASQFKSQLERDKNFQPPQTDKPHPTIKWLDDLISTADEQLTKEVERVAHFESAKSLQTWGRQVKNDLYYETESNDVQFKNTENYETSKLFEESTSKAHGRFSYFSVSEDETVSTDDKSDDNSAAFVALGDITGQFRDVLKKSTPYFHSRITATTTTVVNSSASNSNTSEMKQSAVSLNK